MFLKIIAAMVVCGFMAATSWAVLKVREEVLEPRQAEERFLAMLEESEVDEVEPGQGAFRRALELIALGRVEEGREKLLYVVNFYPGSPAAPECKRILGEMNLDDLLSTEQMEGKSVYEVQRGDSFLGIVAKHDTTLDCLMHLNGLMGLDRLHPGDELIVMPLNLRVIVDPANSILSLWDEGRFLREYRLEHCNTGPVKAGARSRISAKTGVLDGRRMGPAMEGYRGADKVLSLAVGGLALRPMPANREEAGKGIYLAPADIEELALLLRVGNEVEIRPLPR
jgi:hypothetical protein